MEKAQGKAALGVISRTAKKTGDTNRMRRVMLFTAIGLIAVVGASIGFLAVQSEFKAHAKIEDNFRVNQYSISRAEMTSPQNTRVSGDRDRGMPKTLLLSCQVEMSDPNFVLGISPAPVIEELVDDKGRNVEINVTLPSSFHRRYRPPRFHPRFVAAQKPSKWERTLRSILRLPAKRSWRSRTINKLQPSWLHVDISVPVNGRPGGKISRVKGYFYALTAESLDCVDVPFNKSDTWVRLTPDVEVQVREASCDNFRYRLSTEARRQEGASMRPLSPESHIADRLVVDRQLVGSRRKPVRRSARGYFLPYHPGGKSTWGGNPGQITKIRYVIAVNPTHHKIPFVLENIPLPKP
jgi:hypothetical protein